MTVKRSRKLLQWLDDRIPVSKVWKEHAADYYAPKNFNVWYYFGSFALLVFINQIITGIWLTMYYTPTVEGAFDSVEYIMRDVSFGWLIRYMHTTGASFFFIIIFIHMFRGMMYGSYLKPRELLWVIGVMIFSILVAEAFMGYLLPWGQMSYWGAQVIISVYGAIPLVGDALTEWIRGDYNLSGVTLNRFFALHVAAFPMLLTILVFVHIVSLHHVGSNNPDGIEIKKLKNKHTGKPLDGIPFHPYYTVKDTYGSALFLIVFAAVIFYLPEGLGLFLEKDNFVAANPLVTPDHIAPVWYMTPFYAILRAIPDKFWGVMAMQSSILIYFLLPWLDKSSVKSFRYRGPWSRAALALFVLSFIGLGVLGSTPVTPIRLWLARTLTMIYFLFFFLMPFYSRWDKPKVVPERLT